MAVTTKLYDIIQSELIRNGKNEFFEGEKLTLDNITFFDDEKSIMRKILKFDDDVLNIVTNKFFVGETLKDPENDKHFKKVFTNRFLSREMNRQTLEDFSTQVVFVFMTNEDYINRIYSDMDHYLMGRQTNEQINNGTNISDNRSAFANLPQDGVQIDVNNTIMTDATDNTISRNKQANENKTTGKSESYRLDDLLKINGLLEQVFIKFDDACFLQVW